MRGPRRPDRGAGRATLRRARWPRRCYADTPRHLKHSPFRRTNVSCTAGASWEECDYAHERATRKSGRRTPGALPVARSVAQGLAGGLQSVVRNSVRASARRKTGRKPTPDSFSPLPCRDASGELRCWDLESCRPTFADRLPGHEEGILWVATFVDDREEVAGAIRSNEGFRNGTGWILLTQGRGGVHAAWRCDSETGKLQRCAEQTREVWASLREEAQSMQSLGVKRDTRCSQVWCEEHNSARASDL